MNKKETYVCPGCIVVRSLSTTHTAIYQSRLELQEADKGMEFT
jgi:hypothetical protein